MSNPADQINISKCTRENGTNSRRENVEGFTKLKGFISMREAVYSFTNNYFNKLVNGR